MRTKIPGFEKLGKVKVLLEKLSGLNLGSLARRFTPPLTLVSILKNWVGSDHCQQRDERYVPLDSIQTGSGIHPASSSFLRVKSFGSWSAPALTWLWGRGGKKHGTIHLYIHSITPPNRVLLIRHKFTYIFAVYVCTSPVSSVDFLWFRGSFSA